MKAFRQNRRSRNGRHWEESNEPIGEKSTQCNGVLARLCDRYIGFCHRPRLSLPPEKIARPLFMAAFQMIALPEIDPAHEAAALTIALLISL